VNSAASLIGQRLPTDKRGYGDVVGVYRGGLVRTRSGLLWRHDAGRLVTPDGALLARVAYLRQLRRVLPAELVALPNWVCYFTEPSKRKPGKLEKIPVNAHTGRKAKSNDAATWATFDKAGAAFGARGGWAGLGFMLGESQDRRSGFVGVDLDDCFDGDGQPAAWAAEILGMGAGYVEYSPSGTGLHVFTRGELGPGRRKIGGVEAYDWGRFLTVTGRVYG